MRRRLSSSTQDQPPMPTREVSWGHGLLEGTTQRAVKCVQEEEGCSLSREGERNLSPAFVRSRGEQATRSEQQSGKRSRRVASIGVAVAMSQPRRYARKGRLIRRPWTKGRKRKAILLSLVQDSERERDVNVNYVVHQSRREEALFLSLSLDSLRRTDMSAFLPSSS